ncbi:MAG: hypothetical protein A2898_04905 [Candidatus Kerfeldbacteria bacterium RIFCSPLOWO2_01_FULL_48_11]|uniref:Uncharacterized protein n=1 Tax=Candidatus Kerfeldbacteria bacterium RIFCSPLOWO2_01_FULL_48_11 TaxID=1798543 RepID=A0A1G2B133_9BACT|nr:MAG: hypothetical protein UY52_C0016G0051 [Parcubacteria group bacterium GW2011_GWC2_49_9]OGY82892.1 MAG: hypothetical protein A2898_04905 [Candidatus Kerfeldbacteria bacterium RIFCSPLOWO2_01_FULL_48_11]HCJ52787.1 hypothetical protein [Candidatus Kerfeldbacteria bacterium]
MLKQVQHDKPIMLNTSLPPQKQNVNWVIVLHGIVIILIWASPFLFRWQLIIIVILLYFLQIIFLGDCILTRHQFDVKKRGVTFYYFILVKLGFAPDMYRVRFVADYIMPPVILGVALTWQLALNNLPLIF